MRRKKSKNNFNTRRRRLADESSVLGIVGPVRDEVATAALTKEPAESGTAYTERSSGVSDLTAREQGNAAEERNQPKFHHPVEPDRGLMVDH
jgi:hypothetical protein